MRHAKFHSRDHLIRFARSLKANGFMGFDVTGGEPGMHPHLVDLVQEATDIGIALATGWSVEYVQHVLGERRERRA